MNHAEDTQEQTGSAHDDKINLTVMIDREVHKTIVEIAAQRERTMAGQIRLILKEWAESQRNPV